MSLPRRYNGRAGNKRTGGGVYSSMGLRGRPPKFLKVVALIALGILLAPWLWVQGEAWMFRYRTRRLLANIRSFQTHQMSVAEIQDAFYRAASNDLTCGKSSDWCEVDLNLPSLGAESNPAGDDREWPEKVRRVYRFYGGRLGYVRAIAHFWNGSAYFSYQLVLENPTPSVHSGSFDDTFISGGVNSTSGFPIRSDWQGLNLHPGYVIGATKMASVSNPNILVVFGPYAAPDDVTRLAVMDFSCVTRWTPCRAPEELMPEAAAQYKREHPEVERLRKEHACSPEMVRLMARDAQHAAVVEMTGTSMWGDATQPIVQLVEDLTPKASWKLTKNAGLETYDASNYLILKRLPMAMKRGQRFIVLADETGLGPRAVRAELCGIVPLTPENLAFVRSGIAERAGPASPQPPKPQVR